MDEHKERMREIVADAYANGEIAEDAYRQALDVIESEGGDALLDSLSAIAPRALAKSAGSRGLALSEVQEINGIGSVFRKRAPWIKSDRILVKLEGSTARLDMTELALRPGSRIELELELKRSVCRIILPRGVNIEEDLERVGSVVSIPPSGYGDDRIEVRIFGRVEGTVLRVKTSRHLPRLPGR